MPGVAARLQIHNEELGSVKEPSMKFARKPGTGLLLAFLLTAGASAQQERTPRAGEAYTETIFGMSVSAAARDRTHITWLGLGFQRIPDGPEERVLVPPVGP